MAAAGDPLWSDFRLDSGHVFADVVKIRCGASRVFFNPEKRMVFSLS